MTKDYNEYIASVLRKCIVIEKYGNKYYCLNELYLRQLKLNRLLGVN